MKIQNKTNWRTNDLRKVFATVLARWNKIDDKKVPSKRLRNVRVVSTRRRNHMSGCAYVSSGWMTLRLPKSKVDVAQLGFLFEHELAHCAGYEHSAMGPLNSWKLVGSGRYDYLAGLEIRQKEPKAAKPKDDKQIARYQAAVTNLANWRKKMKRAATGVRTYQAKVKRYEKIFAADGRLAALKAD